MNTTRLSSFWLSASTVTPRRLAGSVIAVAVAAMGLSLTGASLAAGPAQGGNAAPSASAAQPTPPGQAAPARSASDSLSLSAARAEHDAGRAVLIDIREPEEHATGVAAGAKLLPMRQLRSRLAEIPTDPQQPVLLICNTQNRSKSVVEALRERGYQHVSFVEGGMSEWVKRGWPTVPPAR